MTEFIEWLLKPGYVLMIPVNWMISLLDKVGQTIGETHFLLSVLFRVVYVFLLVVILCLPVCIFSFYAYFFWYIPFVSMFQFFGRF